MLTPDSIDHHVLRNIEHIPGTNDLWLAEATRAVKNPGKGDYMLVLLRPRTEINRRDRIGSQHGQQLVALAKEFA